MTFDAVLYVRRFLHDLLQKTEDSVGPQLRMRVRARSASQAPTDSKQKSTLLSSSQLVANLIHHLTAALPSLMSSLFSQASADMANASEKDALEALELLHLQISAPNLSAKLFEDLMQQFLAASDNISQHVRLKFVNNLSGCLVHGTRTVSWRMRHEMEQTLVARFWDRVPAVRAAAIRNMVSFTAAWTEEEHNRVSDESAGSLDAHLDVLDKLILRLMDSVPDVREEVCECSTYSWQ
jgi:hypothetical protein